MEVLLASSPVYMPFEECLTNNFTSGMVPPPCFALNSQLFLRFHESIYVAWSRRRHVRRLFFRRIQPLDITPPSYSKWKEHRIKKVTYRQRIYQNVPSFKFLFLSINNVFIGYYQKQSQFTRLKASIIQAYLL